MEDKNNVSVMEDTIKRLTARIEEILKEEKVPVASLSDEPSVVRRLNNQIRGGVTVSADTIIRILHHFPKIDANYLLMGEGPKEKRATVTNDYHTSYGNNSGNSAGGNVTISSADRDLLIENGNLRTRAEVAEAKLEIYEKILKQNGWL